MNRHPPHRHIRRFGTAAAALALVACSNPFATEGAPVHIVQAEANRIPEPLYDQVQVANGRSVALFLDGRNMTWTFPDGTTTTGMAEVSVRGMTDSPDDPTAHDMEQWVFRWPNSTREQAVEYATPVLEDLGLESERFLTDTLEAQREGSPYIATSRREEEVFELYARIHYTGKDPDGVEKVSFSVVMYPLED